MGKNRNSKDALLLAIVKIFSLGVGTISTMLLSKTLSLEIYGTYSALNLLATSGAAISVLGLADAVNFFYNSENNVSMQKKYVNSIFAFQFIVGMITAAIIIFCEPIFVEYFDNNLLKGMCIYVAFRPYLENTIISLQNLQVAIGKAKQIAIRNAVFSLIKVLSICYSIFYTKDITVLLFMIVFMDLLTVIYFTYTFSREKYKIQIFKCNFAILKRVLSFSIPMGVYVMSNMLMREMDKYVIGFFEPTSMLAIYTNCSAVLPLDIITNSFLIVIMPIITRAINNDDYIKAQKLFRNYLMIGIYSTVVFGIALIIVSEEAISLLYSKHYLIGKTVFILFLIVSMIRFANLTLVLSAKGKTKTLMIISISSLILNFILNITLYKIVGFIGPAISTVIITLGTTFVMFSISCKILNISPMKILDKKELLEFIFKLIITSILFCCLKDLLYNYGVHKYLVLFICAGGFSTFMLIINFTKIRENLREV